MACLSSRCAFRFLSCCRHYDPHSEGNMILSLILILIYIQIGCSMVASLGAQWNGVMLANLVAAVFAIVGIEVPGLWTQVRRIYWRFLVCSLLMDVAWFVAAGLTMRTIAREKYGLFFVLSLRLALVLQIIGFATRLVSSVLWIQLYKLDRELSSTVTHIADTEVGNSLSDTTNQNAPGNLSFWGSRPRSPENSFLGGIIYDQDYFFTLFQKSNGEGLISEAFDGGSASVTDGGTSSATEGASASDTDGGKASTPDTSKTKLDISNNIPDPSAEKPRVRRKYAKAFETIYEDDELFDEP